MDDFKKPKRITFKMIESNAKAFANKHKLNFERIHKIYTKLYQMGWYNWRFKIHKDLEEACQTLGSSTALKLFKTGDIDFFYQGCKLFNEIQFYFHTNSKVACKNQVGEIIGRLFNEKKYLLNTGYPKYLERYSPFFFQRTILLYPYENPKSFFISISCTQCNKKIKIRELDGFKKMETGNWKLSSAIDNFNYFLNFPFDRFPRRNKAEISKFRVKLWDIKQQILTEIFRSLQNKEIKNLDHRCLELFKKQIPTYNEIQSLFEIDSIYENHDHKLPFSIGGIMDILMLIGYFSTIVKSGFTKDLEYLLRLYFPSNAIAYNDFMMPYLRINFWSAMQTGLVRDIKHVVQAFNKYKTSLMHLFDEYSKKMEHELIHGSLRQITYSGYIELVDPSFGEDLKKKIDFLSEKSKNILNSSMKTGSSEENEVFQKCLQELFFTHHYPEKINYPGFKYELANIIYNYSKEQGWTYKRGWEWGAKQFTWQGRDITAHQLKKSYYRHFGK